VLTTDSINATFDEPLAASVGRRQFLQAVSAGSASLLVSDGAWSVPSVTSPPKNSICAFTKPLQSLSFDELAETMARIGYNGIEIAVRENGHISPENAEKQLPVLVSALKKQGLELTVLTSGITDVEQPHARTILSSAAGAGVKHYRLGYYFYDLSKPIPPQLDSFRASLNKIVDASRKLGLTPLYQNHSGSNLFGAPLWDLYELVKGYSQDELGVALDVAHMVVEGGLSWPIECNLMRPHVRSIYVKDFIWEDGNVHWTPLGKGRVPPAVFQWLRETKFDGPFSVHVEYLEGLAGAEGNHKNVQAFDRDLKTLRGLLAA